MDNPEDEQSEGRLNTPKVRAGPSVLARSTTACAVAIAVGTAFTTAVSGFLGRGPIPLLYFAAGTAALHLIVIVVFTFLGESGIENIVLSAIFIGLMFAWAFSSTPSMPALPAAALSATALGTATNLYTRRLEGLSS